MITNLRERRLRLFCLMVGIIVTIQRKLCLIYPKDKKYFWKCQEKEKIPGEIIGGRGAIAYTTPCLRGPSEIQSYFRVISDLP